LTTTATANDDNRPSTQIFVATHCILAVLLGDIKKLRDNFKKKLAEKPKGSGRFRSVVGTGAWQKLKETAAV
jgi:hypothetical protein